MSTTPVTISHSSVKKFRRCKRQYFYSVVQELEPRLPDVKLKTGSWFHSLMQAHYLGGDWRKEHAAQLKEFNKLFKEERDIYGDMPEAVERWMESYVWHYRKEEADWEPLYVEQTFKVTFAEGDVFTFKPDLIVRDHSTKEKAIWVVDHKTAKSMPSGEWRLEDLQSTLYPWALREGTDLNVKGFIFNYIRKKVPSVPKIIKSGAISKARLDTDYPTMAKFLMEYYKVGSVNELPTDWKKRLRVLRGETKFFKRSRIIKDDALVNRQIEEFSVTAQEIETWHEMHDEQPDFDPWVRTMIPSCDWDCDYYDLCSIELLGQNSNFIRRSKYRKSTYTKDRGLGRGKEPK